MSKKKTIIALIILALVGSLFAAQATNMLMSDMANKDASSTFNTLFASLGAATIAAAYVVASLFVFRLFLRPQYQKRMMTVYSIIFASLGLIGTISLILNSILNYHSFVAPYPFKGYTIIFLILNVLLLVGPVVGLVFYVKKMEPDQEKFQFKFLYVLKTIGYFLFICLAFNRLGMFLGAPMYVHWRTLFKTFPFYLFLLVPMFILVVKVLLYFDVLKTKKMKVILVSIALGVTVLFAGAYIILGIVDTSVISAISPALPLERLATMPIETIIHLLACLAMTIPCLVILLKNKEAKEQVVD